MQPNNLPVVFDDFAENNNDASTFCTFAIDQNEGGGQSSHDDDYVREGQPNIIYRLFLNDTYEIPFLKVLFSLCLASGMTVLLDVMLVDILSWEKYGLAPDRVDEIMLYLKIIKMPWQYKIFLGIFFDLVRVPAITD